MPCHLVGMTDEGAESLEHELGDILPVVRVNFEGPYAATGEIRAARSSILYLPAGPIRRGSKVCCMDHAGNSCDGEVTDIRQGWHGEFLQIRLDRETWDSP